MVSKVWTYSGGLFVVFLACCALLHSQSAPQRAPDGKSFYAVLNDHARNERASGGDIPTVALIHGAFANAGISPDLADVVGFTSRTLQAQKNYRAGTQPAVHEEDVVKAVNNFVVSAGTPAWTHTTPAEVRKLRMRLVVVVPQLFAEQAPPDAKGHYRAISPNMSPVEAEFVALTMLNMKVFNSDFQFTKDEQTKNQLLDRDTVNAEHLRRTQQMLNVVNGHSNSASARDLLAAGDQLLNDLGIPDSSTSSKSLPVTHGKAAQMAKGGF